MSNILFVCECNLNRSPTWERWFNKNTPFTAKSAGTHYGYPNKLSNELLEWADAVYVMDLKQYKFIYEKYRKHISKTVVLGVSDEYDPDDPKLIELIEWLYRV